MDDTSTVPSTDMSVNVTAETIITAKETIFLVSLGMGTLLLAALCDMWRPGRTKRWVREGHQLKLQYYNLNRDYCGVLGKRGMIIPFILVECLGLMLLAITQDHDVCKTPLGYCSTISCISGNIVWQGYVFMFITLTLTPVLVLVGVLRGARKRLCFTKCYCHFDQWSKTNWTSSSTMHSIDIVTLWLYLGGVASMCMTGMMPSVLESPGTPKSIATLTHRCHLAGVIAGVGLPTVAAMLLSIRRLERCCRVQAKVDPTLPETACERLLHGHHDALAVIGYLAIAPLVLGALMLMAAAQEKADKLVRIYDACIVNDNSTCSLGEGCEFYAYKDEPNLPGLCYNKNCNQYASVATAAEYLLLMIGLMNDCILMPAILEIVGAKWTASKPDDDLNDDEDDPLTRFAKSEHSNLHLAAETIYRFEPRKESIWRTLTRGAGFSRVKSVTIDDGWSSEEEEQLRIRDKEPDEESHEKEE